jgi:4-amino-4-deoxy-L-arabinose transferase-like glycosyltransferase
VVAAFVLPLVLGTPLLDPDEGLHAAIAQEMVERGDWVTPRLLGQPFLDKPILFFWSLAASLALFGFSEFAVKLPGLLFGALGAGSAGLLASRVFGRRTGLLAGVCCASMLLPLALTEAAVHDVALVPWTTMAVLALYNATVRSEWRATLAWGAAAGAWLGLAVLTKALSGVVLVGLPFVLWCVLHRQLRSSVVLAGLISLGVAAAIAAPWYVAMEDANPGYLHYYFVERHLLGYTTTTQLHGQRPWWYYVPVVAGGALPWGTYALLPAWSLVRGWLTRQRSLEARGVGLLVVWIAADVAFLSLAGSKLVTYVLPVFPAIAILAALAWMRTLRGASTATAESPGWPIAHAVACLAMAAAVPAALVVADGWFGLEPGAAWGAAAGASAVAWAWVFWTSAWRSMLPARALPRMVWALAWTVGTALAVLLPAAAPSFTARELARHYNRERRLPGTVWFYDERVGSFIFYLDAPLRASLTPERVLRARPELLLALRHPPADTVIVVPVELLPRLERRVPLSSHPSVLAGHHRAYEAEHFVAALRTAVDGGR